MKRILLLMLTGCITLGAFASAPTGSIAHTATLAESKSILGKKTSECCQFAFATASGALTACDGSTYLHSETGFGFACASSCEAAYSQAYNRAMQEAINLMIAEIINPVSGPPCP